MWRSRASFAVLASQMFLFYVDRLTWLTKCFHCCSRTSPSEFIVPYDQYMESVKNNYSIGMRFKMRFEGEEAPEQRYGL